MDENLQGVGRVDILMSWYLKFKLLNSGRIAKLAYKRKKKFLRWEKVYFISSEEQGPFIFKKLSTGFSVLKN